MITYTLSGYVRREGGGERAPVDIASEFQQMPYVGQVVTFDGTVYEVVAFEGEHATSAIPWRSGLSDSPDTQAWVAERDITIVIRPLNPPKLTLRL